ncbi:hypothetical protein LCGC14_2596010, partial [marine sediment metagenome]
MSTLEKINVGVVGVCGAIGRGAGMVGSINTAEPMQVTAVCDVDAEKLEETRAKLDVPQAYTDYDEMLDKADIDAVFIATPMHLHVPQSIAALEKGIHVLCEVTAAVAVDECKDLVAACKASDAVYMMAENYNYDWHVVVVRQMVLQGLFGTPYYAEGGYVAEIKGLVNSTPWRRKWQLGISGNTYVTHNLGPMLEWMPGQRVTRVCCIGGGHRYSDDDGTPFGAEAGNTMLCKTSDDGQMDIRCDFLSDRPGAGVFNCLQGTEGSYQSPRFPGDPHRIWLAGRSDDGQWADLQDIGDAFLPEYWTEAVAKGLPAGGAYFQCAWFAE